MTLYLWHIPAIAVATFALHAVGLDAYDVDAPGFWGLLALRAVVFAVVMAGDVLRVVTARASPAAVVGRPQSRATGVRSTAAGVLICVTGVALVLLAKNGLVGVARLHPARAFVVCAGAARVSAGGSASRTAQAAQTVTSAFRIGNRSSSRAHRA